MIGERQGFNRIEWCWARQVFDAIVEMQRLVNQAVAAGAGAGAVDPEALAEQARFYRSAAQIGAKKPLPAPAR